MISISLPVKFGNWKTVSFASTLYLSPILDLLLCKVPKRLHPEIRLGLQEALVNAAKHGNKLDPSKRVVVKFCCRRGKYFWVVCDQGQGFIQECSCPLDEHSLPPEEAENGRGLCILHQIFDQVLWDSQGTQVTLSKQVPQYSKVSLLMFL
ncbi:anti-sigma regulatory factor [Cyanobacterium aponinum UTEX 3222]|uniref:ATP-binding protein n=3 Tax=Cyanobacterium aponinum TaxID=379064 RepID=A0A844GU42_9CHRO|nr:anti-sigma regulatory factor [Cyanobacterium aponinum]MBD2394208.1 anti-sigma regulatory factor [Cyanobacterium aponinum FACHB-4101]MTF40007.1 ATP-binding protein [Cyanobacterium aponinum 0216]WRL43028.1 anti-sigma regulatory factor [Cyanobacterium aponinum UTEX 3222]AFZ54988.1 putative anti-sigma regulatory factor, serine/threonine protein kinase [Cyanobacterium aponinum PCC 10605]PHV62522.1 anti-sigma regulatory factor [Cyanobacterium aponinum IPPAS B-1201]